jgi:hypothetical protein
MNAGWNPDTCTSDDCALPTQSCAVLRLLCRWGIQEMDVVAANVATQQVTM